MVASRPEVEWDDNERGWMVALAEWRDGLCPKCGGPVEECQDPANENAFTTPPPQRCHKFTALRRAQKTRSEHPGTHDDALLWGIARR